jgi:hyperosmotically inducible protein
VFAWLENKEKTSMKKLIATAFLMTMLSMALPALAKPMNSAETQKLEKKIRKELVTLPFFSVFDNLSFKVEDGTVTLYGQVVRPSMRKDAVRVVERVTGVEEVVNQIEVLPLSNFDDRIRFAVYRAVYRQPGLDRLSMMAVPPIHIIVKNGNVTLEGIVNNKGDSTRAFIAANGVSNVFSVTNNLRVERD